MILWSFPSVVSRPVSATGLEHPAESLTHTLAQVVGSRGVCALLALVVAVGRGDGKALRPLVVRRPSLSQHAKTRNTELQLRPESRPRCIETCRNLKIGSSSSRARYQSVVSG